MNIKFAYPLRWRAPSPLVENMDAQNEPTKESLSVAVFGKRVPEGPRSGHVASIVTRKGQHEL